MVEVKDPILFLKNIIFTPHLYHHTLVCLILLYFYVFIFSYLLPEGVNQYFTQKMIVLLPIPMALLYCILFYFLRKEQKTFISSDTKTAFNKNDLPLLLFPMTPIVKYILLNFDVLTFFQGMLVFLTFLIIAFILTFVIPLFFCIIGSKTFLMMTGLSFSFLIFNMAALTSDFNWHLTGYLRIQLPILFLGALVPIFIYFKDRKFLNIAVFIFFLAGIISTGVPSNNTSNTSSAIDKSDLYEMVIDREPVFKPDIFLLTYESYVENETMLQYGIDNSEQEEFLLNNGFHVYRGTWTVGTPSLESMGYMLDVSQISPGRRATSGNGVVQNILIDNGYETYGIFSWDWFILNTEPSYDYYFPAKVLTRPYILFSKQILLGQFGLDFDTKSYANYLLEKRSILRLNSSSPIFLYTHNSLPGHSQFTGQCFGNELKLYSENLVKANEEMREDIEIAITNNPDAVIIVCGDHGPYLTKNCYKTSLKYDISEINRLDIQDRYGSFLAIRWPEGADINHDDISILQDIFPVIFAWMYDDRGILVSRIEQLTIGSDRTTSGALVRNGVIEGGVDDGLWLFKSIEER